MTTGDSSNILETLVTQFVGDTSQLEAAFTKAATKAQAEGARIGQGLAVGLKDGIAGAASEVDRVGAQIDKGRQSLSLIRTEQAAGIATSAQYVNALRNQQTELRGMVMQAQKGGDAYRALVGELANVTQELDNVSAAGKQSGGFLAGITGGLLQGASGAGLGGVINLIQQLGQGLSGLAGGGEETEEAMGGVGDSVNNAAEHIGAFVDARKEEDAATREANINQAKAALAFTVTAGAATFLASSLVASFNAAADFEAAMNKAGATTEATATELERLSELALSPAIQKLGVDGIQAAGAIEELGGAGLTTAQILEGALQPTLNLSRAVGTDVATAAEVAAASMKAFGLGAKDLPMITDVITTAVNGTSVKIGDFSQALAQGGAVARASGMSFAEFTAAISLMTDVSISASDGATSLKTYLQALTPNSKEATALMKDLGVAVFTTAGEWRPFADVVGDLREAFSKLTPEQRAVTGETIFGSDAIRAMNVLLDQGAEGIKTRTDLVNKMGATDAAAATQLGGVRSAQELLNTSITNFKIEVGKSFLPGVTDMIKGVTDLLGVFREVNTEIGKFFSGAAAFGAEEYNLPTWLKQTGLQATDLKPDERAQIEKLLSQMQDRANRGAQAAQEKRAFGMPGVAARVEADTVQALGKLGVQLVALQATIAQRPRVLGPGYDPTAEPVDMSQIPIEAGKFGYAYISKLKDVFVNDPKVDSDCAVIAAAILKNIGVQIKGSANAGVLEKNAVAAGFEKVAGDEIRPGDLVVWTSGNGKTYGKVSGKHVGVAAGMKNGQMMVINNPGSSDTQVEAMYDKQNATVYRAPTSAFDMTGNLKGEVDLIPTAAVKTGAALLAEARRILKALATKDPDALVVAQASLKSFEDSGDRAKAALKIVREELGKTKKEVAGFGQGFDKLKTQMGRAEDYKRLSDDGAAYAKTLDGISTAALKAAAAEKAKYGETKKYDALFGLGSEAAGKARQEREALARELSKKPEVSALQREQEAEAERQAQAAQVRALRARTTGQLSNIIKGGVNQEGDSARIKNAEAELKRRAELETKAGQAAKKALEENAALLAKLAKETSDAAFAQAEKRQAQAAKVNEAIRRNDIDAAREALTGLEGLRQKDLDGAKDSATRRYSIEKQSGELIYNARKAVLDKEKADRDADIKNSDLPARVKAAQLATSGTAYTNALNAAKATRDGLLSEAEKGITDLGVKLATTLTLSVGEGLEAGIKSKRADEALSLKAAEWSATLGQSLFSNAMKELTERQRVGFQIQASGNDAIAAAAQKTAGELAQGEQWGEALDVLGGALDRVMTSALEGEDAGDSINTLTQAINDLVDARARAIAQARQEQAASFATPIEANPARNPGTMLDALGRPLTGTSDARRTRPDERLNADGTPYVDPGTAARDAGAADRNKAWEGVMRSERVDAYKDSLKLLDLQQLDTAKSAAILAQDTERYGFILSEIASKKAEQAADGTALREFQQQAAALAALDEQLAPVAVNLQSVFDRLGSGAQTAGDARVELAALRSQLEGIGGDAAQNLIRVIDEAVSGFDTLGSSSAQVTAALLKLRGEAEQPYDALIRNLEEMKTKPGAAVQEIEMLIQKLKELNAEAAKTTGIEKLGDGFQKLSTGLSSVFKGFGAEGLGQIADGLGGIVSAASKAPGALAEVRTSWAAFKKAPDAGALGGLLGSLGGIASIAGAVIGAIGSIGDALLKNNPAVQAQIKGWLELAAAEKEAMGQRMVGGRNGFLNPFYDALKDDAEKLTTKANAGFWQRWGWSLFGGAPKEMDKAASESLQKASAVFNEFGSSLYNDLSSALMDAINQGDFSKINDVLKVQLDKFVQKAAIDALIAKSNLAPLIEELATTSAAGGDTASIMARIRAEENRIAGQVQAIAPSLPGYGAGAAGGANGAPGGALFGNAPGAQLGIPRIEISLPDVMTRGFSDFAVAVPVFSEASSRMLQAANLLLTLQGSGPPPLSGLGGLT